MTNQPDLDELLARLGRVGELALGCGPEHPSAPEPALATDVAKLLAQYPFLRRDPGYVAFLERYAGAVLWRDQDLLSLGLFGFHPELSTHLVTGPGEIIEHGFFTFCDMVVPRDPDAPFGDSIGLGFGFDATQERRWGVYRLWGGGKADWYCDTFLEWLEQFIAKGGRLIDDTQPPAAEEPAAPSLR